MLTEEQIRKMLADPTQADWSKLRASDIKMQMGRALTEDEMRAHCARHNITPTILKKPPGSTQSSSTSTSQARPQTKRASRTLSDTTKAALRSKLIPHDKEGTAK